MTESAKKRAALKGFKTWEALRESQSIWDAYARPSKRKEYAWLDCKRLCSEYAGTGLSVVSHNSMMFTAGFEFMNPETGEAMYMHIAPSFDYAIVEPVD